MPHKALVLYCLCMVGICLAHHHRLLRAGPARWMPCIQSGKHLCKCCRFCAMPLHPPSIYTQSLKERLTQKALTSRVSKICWWPFSSQAREARFVVKRLHFMVNAVQHILSMGSELSVDQNVWFGQQLQKSAHFCTLPRTCVLSCPVPPSTWPISEPQGHVWLWIILVMT